MIDERQTEAARVLSTGIALVHEGELVLPAVGSQAQAERVADDARSMIQYIFPVEIEVREAASSVDLEQVVDITLRRLVRGLESA